MYMTTTCVLVRLLKKESRISAATSIKDVKMIRIFLNSVTVWIKFKQMSCAFVSTFHLG